MLSDLTETLFCSIYKKRPIDIMILGRDHTEKNNLLQK